MASETLHSSINAGTNSTGSSHTRRYTRQEALPQSPKPSQSPQGISQPTQKQGVPQSSPKILQIQITSVTKTLTGDSQSTPCGRQRHLARNHLEGSLMANTNLEFSGPSAARLESMLQAGTSTSNKLEHLGLARSIVGTTSTMGRISKRLQVHLPFLIQTGRSTP